MINVLLAVDPRDVIAFSVIILVVFFLMFTSFIISYWVSNRKDSISPYSNQPLRRASELSFYSKEKVLRYLYNVHQYDNRIFEFQRAAVCRETGRIFPLAVTWYDVIQVDWSFLVKRYPGHYVSWGSLTPEQKAEVKEVHGSLEKFQTTYSSANAQPKLVEKEYAFAKPGPLYVDIHTFVLLGWQSVPETELEVLVVQKPLVKDHRPLDWMR